MSDVKIIRTCEIEGKGEKGNRKDKRRKQGKGITMKEEKRIPDEIVVEGEKMEEKNKRSLDIKGIAIKALAVIFFGWITLKIILINVIDVVAFINFIKNLF